MDDCVKEFYNIGIYKLNHIFLTRSILLFKIDMDPTKLRGYNINLLWLVCISINKIECIEKSVLFTLDDCSLRT